MGTVVEVHLVWVLTTPDGDEIPLWSASERRLALCRYWDLDTGAMRAGYGMDQRRCAVMIPAP
jgi:hypothetical protein